MINDAFYERSVKRQGHTWLRKKKCWQSQSHLLAEKDKIAPGGKIRPFASGRGGGELMNERAPTSLPLPISL